MKILLVANTDWYLYNFRRSLASFLHTHGHEVVLVSPRGSYVQPILEQGFHWQEWQVDRKSTGPGELLAIARLARLYQREKPDLVHHFTIKPVLYGTLAGNLTGISMVVNAVTGLGYVFLQNNWRTVPLRWAIIRLYRLVLRAKNRVVIFENKYDRQFFEQLRLVASGVSRVIEGAGVDVHAFTPAPEPQNDPLLVVLPARMLWDKGVGTAVKAMRLLKEEKFPLRLALVGSNDPGNPANIPGSVLQEWVAEGIVEWWGFRADMRAVYHQANIITLPSLGEGVPTVLLEAAACGRAVVATDVPGCSDVVADGETGVLVPPNDPVALASALRRLACDPPLRARFAAGARQRAVERFSIERINQEILEVYQRLVDSVTPGLST